MSVTLQDAHHRRAMPSSPGAAARRSELTGPKVPLSRMPQGLGSEEGASAVERESPRDATVQDPGPRRFDPFKEVKQLMIHGAEGYLGTTAVTLVRQIATARDEEQIRSAMGQWRMAMRESKYGRAEVTELMVRVTVLLHDASLMMTNQFVSCDARIYSD